MYFIFQPRAFAAGLRPSWKPWQTGWLQTRKTIVLPLGGFFFNGVVMSIDFGVPEIDLMYAFACAIDVLGLTAAATPELVPATATAATAPAATTAVSARRARRETVLLIHFLPLETGRTGGDGLLIRPNVRWIGDGGLSEPPPKVKVRGAPCTDARSAPSLMRAHDPTNRPVTARLRAGRRA